MYPGIKLTPISIEELLLEMDKYKVEGLTNINYNIVLNHVNKLVKRGFTSSPSSALENFKFSFDENYFKDLLERRERPDRQAGDQFGGDSQFNHFTDGDGSHRSNHPGKRTRTSSSEMDDRKMTCKLHSQFAHPNPKVLKRIIQKAGIKNKKLEKEINLLAEKCITYLKFQKRPPRPVVSVAWAT